MQLTREDIEEVLKILDSTAYDELHLETDRFVLHLLRTPGGWTEEHEVRGEVRLVARGAEGAEEADPRSEQAVDSPPEDGTDRAGLHAVQAPLPGIFYRAPKPGEPPFVEIGDQVEPETVVAILETMKLMNPVRAGAAGTVADFAVANNELAVQGAVLLWIAPAVPDVPDGPASEEP